MNPTESRQAIDYRDIAERYNDLARGQVLRLPRVYNITHFRRALERRGLTHRIDFKVSHQGSNCVIKRLSDVEMRTQTEEE